MDKPVIADRKPKVVTLEEEAGRGEPSSAIPIRCDGRRPDVNSRRTSRPIATAALCNVARVTDSGQLPHAAGCGS